MNVSNPTPPLALVIGSTAGLLGFVLIWVRSRQRESGRFVERLYLRDSFPIFLRNIAGLAPVWAAVAGLWLVAVFVPRPFGQWLGIASLPIAFAAFALSYRVPAPFLPDWLRTDIDSGVIPAARPDAGDWILFAFAAPFGILALPAGIILIVVFHAGSGG